MSGKKIYRCRLYVRIDDSGAFTFADIWDEPGFLELEELSTEDGWELMLVSEDEDKQAMQRLVDHHIKMLSTKKTGQH